MPTTSPAELLVRDDATRAELARHLVRAALHAPLDHLSDVASWHAHVPFGYALVGVHRPRTVVELGVHKGDSFLTLCRGLVDHGVEGMAFGIDTWKGDEHAGFYDGDAILAEVERKLESGLERVGRLTRSTFDAAVGNFASESIDLLHIDGLHTYDAVRHDFETWLPKMSRRGIVLFHDTQVRSHEFGVWQLWQEVSRDREAYEFTFGNGLGVLIVGSDVGADTYALIALLRDNFEIEGVPVVSILERIGRGQESRTLAYALERELERRQTEFESERRQAQAEIRRLNAEFERERLGAATEIARINAEFENERIGGKTEIERLNALLQQEQSVAYGQVAHERSQAEYSAKLLLRLNAEFERDRSLARAEVDRLNALLQEQRAVASGMLETNVLDESAKLMLKLTGEFDRDRSVANEEIARLNAVIEHERVGAKAEIERLNAEIERDRSLAKAEYERLNAIIQEEHKSATEHLERERARADESAAEGLRIKDELDRVRAGAEESAAEALRIKDELDRVRAGAEESAAEALRIKDELDRVRAGAEESAAEALRIKDEFERVRAGAEESAAEALRIKDELDRERADAEAETARLNAEIEREREAAKTRLQHELEVHSETLAEMDRLASALSAADSERSYFRGLVESKAEELQHRNADIERVAQELSADRQLLEANLSVVQAQRDELLQLVDDLRVQIAQRNDEVARLAGQITELEKRTFLPLAKLSRVREKARHKARLAKHSTRHKARMAGRHAIAALPVSQSAKVRIKHALLSVAGSFFGIRRGPVEVTLSEPLDHGPALDNERYRRLAASARGLPNNLPERSVSIVIPVYNQLAYTLACLESVKENTTDIDYEIIVVDDCSSDATQETLLPRLDLIYVRNERNRGFIGSCNAGANVASNNYICFLNNDTKVKVGWLSALVNTFELHENVGLAGSKLVYPDGRLQEAGGLIWNDGSGWNWGRLQDPSNPRYNYARIADYCSGASIVLPRALFNALGGFDPHYSPAYGEDSDLAFKVRSLGLTTMYQPLSEVVHFEGVTSGTDTTQGVKKHQVVNAEKLAKRWAPALAHQGENGKDANIVSDRGVAGRILVLDQITPEPDRDAGSITALELMRALRDLGHKITFVPCSNLCYLPPYSDVLSALGIESVLLPWVGSFEAHMKEYGPHYDAVLIFRPQTWHDHIAEVRKYAPQAKVIYHSSDLHFLREERERLLAGKPPASDHADEGKRAELDLIDSADLCIVHSSMEQQLLKELRPDSKVACFPWIYEARGRGNAFAARHGLVYLGGYGHPPNVDAVEYYVKEIHPKAIELLPETCAFIAAGSLPPPSLQAMAGPRIKVPGYVEDLAPTLFETRVMVVPLRYGAGIKGKILTAMAHGLPIVTTSIGAEGMDLVDGEHVLVADTPDDFARATARLYGDAELWQRLQQAGLDYVQRTISREAGLKTVDGLLGSLGVPSIVRVPPAIPAGGSAAFGSRRELAEVEALIRAGATYLTAAPTAILLPDNADAPIGAVATSATKFTSIWGLSGDLREGSRLVVLTDAYDGAGIVRLARALRNALRPGMECAVVFAPPQMSAERGRYRMQHAFSKGAAESCARPVHEAWADDFKIEGLKTTWMVDRSLTGFPSLFVAKISDTA